MWTVDFQATHDHREPLSVSVPYREDSKYFGIRLIGIFPVCLYYSIYLYLYGHVHIFYYEQQIRKSDSRIPMTSYEPLCSLKCLSSSGDIADGNCTAIGKVEVVLHRFGLPSFRPGQLESMLHGHDVFIKMATGAGKSLCMFLVPLAYSDSATAVIISPFITLMNELVYFCMT